MWVDELNRDQLIELKQRCLTDMNSDVSMGELANADNLISDDTIMEAYRHTKFTEDDFDGLE